MKKLLNFNINQLGRVQDDTTNKIDEVTGRDIAIIGISGKFGRAESIDEFWLEIKNGRDFITEIPDERRKDTDAFLRYMKTTEDELQYSEIAYLNKIDGFDCDFFKISPKEASLMDPNQRLFLQTAWEAMEDAGLGGKKLYGSKTGVFVGFGDQYFPYRRLIEMFDPSEQGTSVPGNIEPFIAGRLSYLMDFKGTNMVVNTACSSSLMAVYLACREIRSGMCDMAIAGGVNIVLAPIHDGPKLGIESSDGRTRSFDSSSDGTGSGEGAAAVLLKPLSKALRDRDNIYAVIKGISTNHGGHSNGIAAPNPAALEDVIAQAWEDAGIDPETISYIECHGTGTKLGDTIEIEGIDRAFSRYTAKKQFCAVGSVKTNIGHLDSAAGIAGLVKAVLSLKHGELPPSIHFNCPNSAISFENSAVYVNNILANWKAEGFPKRCGVNSLGLSGTNCHIILEEAPKIKTTRQPDKRDKQVLSLSAKNKSVLYMLIKNYKKMLDSNTDKNIEDICYTANTGRGHYSYRLALISDSIEDLRQKIALLCKSDLSDDIDQNIYYGQHKIMSSSEQVMATGEITYEEAEALSMTAAEKISDFIKSDQNDEKLLHKICKLYVKGAEIEWDKLYWGKQRKRISLPVYPFEQTRCWIKIAQTANVQNGRNQSLAILSSENEEEVMKTDVVLKGNGKINYTKSEIQLAQIYSSVLGHEMIDIRDNFYELGGDSLIAVKIVQAIRKAMNIELEIADLFTHLTIKDLALYIDEKKAETESREISYKPIERAPEKEYYPLTSAQRRHLALMLIENIGITFNLPQIVIIEGSLDPDRLNCAFVELLNRHDILRTSFEIRNGEYVQIIHDKVEFKLQRIKADESELEKLTKQFVRTFDLSEAPLIRAALIMFSETKYALLYDMDHLVSDGMSLILISSELLSLYNGQKLEPVDLQYKDYAVWQEKRYQSNQIEKQRKYWTSLFNDGIPMLNMPFDFERKKKPDFKITTLETFIDGDTVNNLKKFAIEQNITLNIICFTLYSVLLSKFCNHSDIVTATVVAGRDHEDIQKVIGDFAYTVPVRMDIDGTKTLLETIYTAKRVLLDAYKYQDYPFEELADPNIKDKDPIVETFLNFHSEAIQNTAFESGGLKFSVVDFNIDVMNVDLRMNIFLADSKMDIKLDYNKSVFKREKMKNMLDGFSTLIYALTADTDSKISDIDV